MYKKYEYLIYLKNNKFWKIIAKSLQDSGSRKEANDCKKKMDNLKATYKTCFEHIEHTGNDKAAKCEYYKVYEFWKKFFLLLKLNLKMK